ncbi:WASH complex subunit 4 [Lutzomyia longipalpis]|uniref:WASH complex subunit 4 n=1 Tax=Lutzomyia longipalpis TaxID=7200 RepID=UPI00248408E5|nr:WASH complex subunit 4 [Lutzomyia longipalpis]XP_055688109.1 WASH complex subunit 4 [Lutzomyia longipalpis]
MQSPNNKGKAAENICGEQQLRQFGKFLDSHSHLLLSLDGDHSAPERGGTFTKCHTTIDYKYRGNCENISLFQLVESDNKVLNKNIIVFAFLSDEIEYLRKEAERLQLNLLYYDEDVAEGKTDTAPASNVINEKVSTVLEYLCNTRQFLERCNDVLELTVKQFSAFFDDNKCLGNADNSTCFHAISDKMCDLFVSIYIFDEIFGGLRLRQFWNPYKKQMTTVCVNGDQFRDYTDVDLNGLKQMIGDLDVLFQGRLVESALERCVRVKGMVPSKALGRFATQMQAYIKRTLGGVMKYPQDISELGNCQEILRVSVMCIFYHAFFGNLDQKCFKNLLEISNKFCGITLISNIVWCPEVFIRRHAATLLKGHERFVSDANKVRQIFLTTKTANLPKEVNSFAFRTLSWTLQMMAEQKMAKSEVKIDQIRVRASLFTTGVKLAGQMSHLIKCVTNLHVIVQQPMQKHTLMNVCKLLELLISIPEVFQHFRTFIVESVNSIIQHFAYQAIYLVNAAKKTLSRDNYNERILDSLAALQIAERCFYGPATRTRINIARIALCVFESNATSLNVEYVEKLMKILERLSLIVDLQDTLNRVCDTSFLFWHQSLFRSYLKQYFDQGIDHQRILATFAGINKCAEGIGECKMVKFTCQEQFIEGVMKTMSREVIMRLCGQIETSLRLDFHSNLQVDAVNPFVRGSMLVNSSALLAVEPIRVADRYVSLRRSVEAYLSNMFYNLTTISLHDWRTYGEMRRLAGLKMNLVTVADHLPTQIIEQGCDVLDIMRNIHVFVAQYVYNLNNQVFIERTSANKHLNTINIRHIANSLRTHGIGVVNTTVNFTYQFLKRKIYVLSQFLYDERIKSRLVKDQKWFRDNRERLGQMYAYERADAFNKGIRKLGITDAGESYLDTFRLLVSHIGNAMGYVRMMRSGCIHTCSMASAFLPSAEERGSLTLSELATNEGLSSATCTSAANLQGDIEHLWRQWSEGTEYFRLLVDTLAPFLRDAKNVHLKTFYIIVPPLTINFIEHILSMKDRMGKKNRQDALFTDDGFVMGLAYILKLLDQIDDFNSLHWFRAVKVKYAADREKIAQQRKEMGTVDDVKLQQTLALTERRIQTFQQEFDLLYYNLSSAKIFFSN